MSAFLFELLEPIMCRKANWSASFDRKGWSNCPTSHPYINGFERSRERFLKDDFISNLEGAQCCKAISPHTSEKSNCTTANWWLSLDKYGHFMDSLNYGINFCVLSFAVFA